jgi:hypothetical protein
MSTKTAGRSPFAEIERLEALAAEPGRVAADILKSCETIYAMVAGTDLAQYPLADLRAAAPQLMHRLFDVRVALRDHFAGWEASGQATPDVQRAVRDCFRMLRYASDMLGELAIGYRRLGEDDATFRAFTGTDTNTLTNRRFDTGGSLPFRSGDIVVVRGKAHNSAAIARIGDVDSQFSHVGMIYVDQSGRHYMVEALIEDGAIVNTLEHALDHGLGRAVVYRHRDAALAVRAAEAIHAHVARSRRALRRRILYDFTMRLDKRRRLFCAKLIRLAFDRASNGRIMLPRHPSRFTMKNRDFLERIGVKATETFAPHDMDLETEFDLVAEWQDYRVTGDLRLQDFTMDKLFEWMEGQDYRFQPTLKIRLIALLGRFAAMLAEDIKDLIKNVVPKVPINMPRKTIAAVAMLHSTAEAPYRALQDLERAHIAANGHAMHGRQIYEHLERMRGESGTTFGYLAKSVAT